jgi:tRNA pseudouridine(38-40) synthase
VAERKISICMYLLMKRQGKPVQFSLQCREAAQQFVGRHDFRHFANTIPEGVDPVKLIRSFTVTEAAHHLVRLEVEGSGFLYRQVRHMVSPCTAVTVPQRITSQNMQVSKHLRSMSQHHAQGCMAQVIITMHRACYWTVMSCL